ncbi:hypothetical protein [Marinobacterium sp. xm-d-509]
MKLLRVGAIGKRDLPFWIKINRFETSLLLFQISTAIYYRIKRSRD